MNAESAIRAAYQTLYQGMIAKDRATLEQVLAPSFVLVHMTGLEQSREVFLSGIENGTLNYYAQEPVEITVTLRGRQAKLIGRSLVTAAVFGGGRNTWRLRLDIDLSETDGVWRMTRGVASTF